MNIGQKIGQIGENPDFIAFQAHAWFAYAVVFTSPWRWTWLAAVALATAKEYVYDRRVEQWPPQTVRDSTLDFVGYAAGIGLACALR